MKIFLGWSGKRSKTIAAAFRDWLPDVIQGLEPWMSDKDIESGSVWDNEIVGQLKQARFGIVFIVPENMMSIWIHFEAGALARQVEDETRVCPYLFGMRRAQLERPLARFQAAEANREDTKRLIETLNRHLGERALDSSRFEKAFNTWWPKLEVTLKEIPEEGSTARTRTDSDMIEEMLNIVRRLERSAERVASGQTILAIRRRLGAEVSPELIMRQTKKLELIDEKGMGNPSENVQFRELCAINGISGFVNYVRPGEYEADFEYTGRENPVGPFSRVIMELERLGYIVKDVGNLP